MKKFKTSADKKALEQKSLEHLLAEKNLLFNVFIRYIHLPLGIVVTLMLFLVSWLAKRPLFSIENVLLAYLGIAAVSLFYMSQAWFSFRSQRARLQNVRNSFVGSTVYPALFAALLIYLALPLGRTVILCVLGLFVLIVAFHFKFGQTKALSAHAGLGSVLFAFYFGLLLCIPALAPKGQVTPYALGTISALTLVFVLLFLRFKKIMFLEVTSDSDELTLRV